MNQLTKEELGYFRELYNVINKDCENSITHKELSVVLNALGCQATESQVQDMISEADTDGNGTLEFHEFVNVLLRKMNADEDDMREAFFIYDKDKNGFISAAELRTIYIALGVKISEEDIDEMVREADLDQDGVITLEEFLGMLTSQ